MVTFDVTRPVAPWESGHFVGGHLALDLTNTVYQRFDPPADNELLKGVSEIVSWGQSVGLLSPSDAQVLTEKADNSLVEAVRSVREQTWEVFRAISRDEAPPADPLGGLLETSGRAIGAGLLGFTDAELNSLTARWDDSQAFPAALALLALEALFTLPHERIRACPRCGWLFVDTSKGGRRRWCSMDTCGNRAKAGRFRAHQG